MRLAKTLTVLALAALPCRAQSLRVGDVCVIPQPVDTVDAILTLAVRPFDPRQRIPAEYAAVVSQEIARHIEVSRGLHLVAIESTRADSTVAYPSEMMMAEVTLDRSGAVISATPVTRSLSPAFDSLMLAAAMTAGAASAIPPAPARARGDSLRFRATANVGQKIGEGEILVASLRVPAWKLSRIAWPVQPYVTPRYPGDMRRKNIEGEVIVDYVVGTDSLPVLPTIRVARYTDIAFWDEVRKVLPRNRVAPAMIGDCPVASRVRQPFHFSLR